MVATAIVAFAPSAGAQGTPSAPPAAGTAAPAATPEEAAKPVAEDKDVNRAVYISVDIGFVRSDVGAISNNTGFDKTAANGFSGSLGLGYRYKDLRIGARFRDVDTTEYALWSVMGEVGYGLPFRPVSPVLFAHAGYMFSNGIERGAIASALPPGNVLTPQAQLDGLVVGGELVASVWLTKFLRVGPFLGVDFAWLHRSQLALPQSVVPITADTRNNALYSDSGSGVGYLLSIGIRGTGDIGF